jgi:acyl-CoA synthetase (AMP-forming)/AMP-acid ligase II
VRDEDLADVDGQPADLSCWRLALNGAEPIAPRTLRAFRERFAAWGLRPEALTPVYGLSEAALAVTFSDPMTAFLTRRFDRAALSQGRAEQSPEEAAEALELVSVGRPLPGFDVVIRGPSGEVCSEGLVGRIWVAGPSLTSGYLNRPESPVRDGWLDTGDVGFLLDGELYITGRAKDVLILRGRNHAPQELEHAVDAVDGVRTGCSAAVAEISSEGERLLVFVEAREDDPELAERCRKAVLSNTGLDPDLVVILAPGTLPRTSSGKIRRAETLSRWQQGELLPPDKVTPWLLAGALAKSALGYWRGR